MPFLQGQVSPAGMVSRDIGMDPLAYPEAVGCQLAVPVLQSENVKVIVPQT
jgi:hypothetical protein